ncbi:S41 family peptidase [Hymenobacter arizonensis]|uniref:Peptidase family S41 n=1 Tax=Hymenobacter arizonensis TaxID=1227077 RepID=A0A1I6B883_HYMAR|nr:S41 family peptidase [Hymenobacter arizonensis]SFQ77166.1 Peptidase family S41 [Hymenobacter arizonensis]
MKNCYLSLALLLGCCGIASAQAPTTPSKSEAVYKADQDTAFRRGSSIALDNLTEPQIESLAVLGRVWGFVKYYHPAVARGEHNMDAAMLRVLPQVLESKNAAARNQVLSAWVASFGPVPACRHCPEPSPDKIRLQADLAWLQDKKQLSNALSQQLVYLRQNRNQGEHYYVRPAPGPGNPVFQHEYSYATPETPDAGLRLLSLYRYWNMIAYFFPYRYAIGEDWQQVLPEFIPQFAAARTDEQYRLAALAIIARIHDTHANIIGGDKILNTYKGTLHAPVQVRFVEGQAVVTDYFHETLGPATGLQKGDVVLTVDGTKVTDLIKARQPITPASNEPTQLRNIARDLLRGPTDKVTLLVRRDGRDFLVPVARVPAAQLNLALNNGTPDPQAPAWRLLPGNIGLLTMGTLRKAQIPGIMQAAKETKGMVIDLRNYPAEFVVLDLAPYLMQRKTEFVRFSQPVVTYPGMFEHRQGPTLWASKGPAYAGKVIILVNELSQSQAEYTTMAFRTAPGAMVVGSTTAGADGNVSVIPLPGNINTWISGIGVYYPDGRETQRIGIVPDVVITPTIQGIRDGRDEVLEKAVQLIEGK